MMTTSLQFMTTAMMMQNTSTVHSDWQTAVLNHSAPEGCIVVRLSQMPFVPSHNPDNIVSADVRTYVREIRLIMLLTLFLIGGPANIINMAVFFKQGLKERVNLLLFSLSLSDEFYLLISFAMYCEELYPIFVSEAKEKDQLFPPSVVLRFMIDYHLIGLSYISYVSIALSVTIACERCYCVLRPLKYHTVLRTRTTAFIIAGLSVIFLGVGLLLGLRSQFACLYDPETGVVTETFIASDFYLRYTDLVDYLDGVFFGAELPVVMMVVLVITTTVTTTKLWQIVAWRTDTTSSLSPKEIALTKMLIGTSVLLIVCMLPSCLFRVACLFMPEINPGRRHENFYLTGLWITEMCWFVNSSFNICMYYLMGSRYREIVWELFTTKAKKRKQQLNSSNAN